MSRATITPEALRRWAHPTEESRATLALVGVIPVVIVALAAIIASAGTIALAALVAMWLTGRITEARLRGGAVEVGAKNFSEIATMIDELRARLDYPKQVKAFVIQDGEINALLWRVFGRKYLALNSGLVSAMTEQEVEFVVARFIGALKERHLRFREFASVIEGLDNLWVLNVLVMPYMRATVYSGDRVGLAIVGDLAIAQRALAKLLIGPDLGRRLSLDGVLEQGRELRRSPFRTLAVLFSPHPHMTDRFLELEAFAAESGLAG